MRLKKIIGVGVALLATIAAGGYWYVFIDGAQQLDGPDSAMAAEKTTLSYNLATYNSQVMGMPRTYGVMLPPGYSQHPHQHYPVVFLLHGGHGDPTDWFKKGAALPVIQKLFESKRLPLSIIITPDGNDSRGSSPLWDPAYIDGKNGRVLSAIGSELVHVVQKTYRTKPQPQFWAIGGLSSGGWGALNIGLHFPQNFSVLFSHSGYFTDQSGPNNSPMTSIAKLSPTLRRNLRIYLDAGQGDGKFLTQSQEFHAELTQLGVQHVFHEFPGGHGIYGADVGWNYWHHHLQDSLTFVGDRFKEADLAERASQKLNSTSQKVVHTHLT
ncbi:esterase family protein [Kovacikia minuta CCNUW1]|uniref:alpha/beta hydrolase n=1 Tax=Kovacikia minuta TaxID=2931930 RepID=UPI001CC9016E|nr:alpha/beta hydrolase-fold protein [Kovacikia minuta]UBF25709.1 esterase family protein [Kovacikia minuta CCNUW1]